MATIGLAILVAACGSSGDDEASGENEGTATSQAEAASLEELPSGTEELCGTDEIRIAQVDGFGGNSWREIVRAELADELAPCDNIEVTYAQANGEIERYNSAIDSFISRGYDIILTLGDDFGPQALPALRRAYNAGLVVVPYGGTTTGVPGQDLTAEVTYDRGAAGEAFGQWLNEVLSSEGGVLFMGGIAGNSSSPQFLEAAMEVTEPGIEWLQDEPVTTDWDPAQYQRVTTGLLAKYPEIDAYVSDYGAASVGQLRAYENAGEPHPPMAAVATSNELGCMYRELKGEWPDFEMIWIDGTTRTVRWGVRRALAELNDIELDDPETLTLFPFVDTTEGDEPPCDEGLPPDADLSSGLTEEQLGSVFE